MSRVLGLDYGEKRLGFALSDHTEMLATPLRVVTCRSEQEALIETVRICKEIGAERLVVGMPINMNGTRGPAAQNVDKFIQKLSKALAIPIEIWDERLSTKSATDVLIEAGASRKRRKEVVDKLAAQIFLQNYLDARAFKHEEQTDS
jgi:putative Holliday junction resolvase